MLSNATILKAGQNLYKSEYASEWHELGGRFPAGSQLEDEIADAPEDRILAIMRPIVSQLETAWERSADDVFADMGLEESDHADALYYVLMNCRGHGIGLDDQFPKTVDAYREKTGEAIDPSPFHSEMNGFMELAFELMTVPVTRVVCSNDPDNELAAVVTARVRKGLDVDLKDAISNALEQWVERSDTGKRFDGRDFNIGDLAEHTDDSWMRELLNKEGVADLDVVTVSGQGRGHWYFDETLI